MRNLAALPSNGIGVLRRVANGIPGPVRPIARWAWSHLNKLKVHARSLSLSQQPHGLPGELIISITSYPARFPTLHLTLRCLLTQSVRPDRVILWIAHEDVAALPESVLKLKQHGLEIRACEDLRSYKKLIPAIATFPEAYIVTADDDLYYPGDWLQVLVAGVDLKEPVIVGRRVVRVVRGEDGCLAPFSSWDMDVADEGARRPSRDLMCETGGGALFPPRSLHQSVTDHELFRSLCPNGDDLWVHWCARMAGTLTKKVGDSLIIVSWRGSQASSLWATNEQGGNDQMIAALEQRLGYPG